MNRDDTVSRRLPRDTRGAVYLEFLIAFMPVFVFFLCLLQLSLLYASKLIVEHAAVQGARAAAVVFGDQPEPYGEQDSDKNTLTPKRRQAVRDAVLITLAPQILDASLASVEVAFPTAPGGPDQPVGAQLPPMTDDGAGIVRVRVEADVACRIAIANAIACTALKNDARAVFSLGRVMAMHSEAVFPYQGARYVYETKRTN